MNFVHRVPALRSGRRLSRWSETARQEEQRTHEKTREEQRGVPTQIRLAARFYEHRRHRRGRRLSARVLAAALLAARAMNANFRGAVRAS